MLFIMIINSILHNMMINFVIQLALHLYKVKYNALYCLLCIRLHCAHVNALYYLLYYMVYKIDFYYNMLINTKFTAHLPPLLAAVLIHVKLIPTLFLVPLQGFCSLLLSLTLPLRSPYFCFNHLAASTAYLRRGDPQGQPSTVTQSPSWTIAVGASLTS